jgi:drug/metabolite transporter (DMT)-like permease
LRIVVENIILFLLPAALYVGYMVLVRRAGQSPRQVMDDAPLLMLFIAGVGLIAATLLIFGVRGAEDEGRAGQAYEPSVYKDGKLTPSKVK